MNKKKKSDDGVSPPPLVAWTLTHFPRISDRGCNGEKKPGLSPIGISSCDESVDIREISRAHHSRAVEKQYQEQYYSSLVEYGPRVAYICIADDG